MEVASKKHGVITNCLVVWHSNLLSIFNRFKLRTIINAFKYYLIHSTQLDLLIIYTISRVSRIMVFAILGRPYLKISEQNQEFFLSKPFNYQSWRPQSF